MNGRDERRRFTDTERVDLYLAANGRCEKCGAELEPGWHGDHVHPHSRGGPTDVINGQALCPACNHRKGSSMNGAWPGAELRDWQREALDVYLRKNATDFLAVASGRSLRCASSSAKNSAAGPKSSP